MLFDRDETAATQRWIVFDSNWSVAPPQSKHCPLHYAFLFDYPSTYFNKTLLDEYWGQANKEICLTYLGFLFAQHPTGYKQKLRPYFVLTVTYCHALWSSVCGYSDSECVWTPKLFWFYALLCQHLSMLYCRPATEIHQTRQSKQDRDLPLDQNGNITSSWLSKE